jgi:hypothetical protein
MSPKSVQRFWENDMHQNNSEREVGGFSDRIVRQTKLIAAARIF